MKIPIIFLLISAFAAVGSKSVEVPLSSKESPFSIKQLIAKIRDIPSKISEEISDKDAQRVMNQINENPKISMFLLTDDSKTKVIDLFHYRVCDIVHWMLCRKYHQDFYRFALPELKSPSFKDYLNKTSTMRGRQYLQRKWREKMERENEMNEK